MAHPNPRLVTSAASRLKSHVIRTPLLEAPLFNEFVQDTLKLKGARVKVKAENLQHTGAFKFRGATNKLLQLSDFQKSQGVVAFSSGNFRRHWPWLVETWASSVQLCLRMMPRLSSWKGRCHPPLLSF